MDEAFMKLFARHQRAVYALIRSFCRRPEDADDIFQETFIAAWRKREEYQSGSNFLAWAGTIARFEALAFARREGRGKVLFNEAILASLTQHAARRGEGRSARLHALRNCLAALPARQRDLIEQRYAPGGSVQSIAARMGRSANSVSVALHALRRKLLGCIQRRLAGETR